MTPPAPGSHQLPRLTLVLMALNIVVFGAMVVSGVPLLEPQAGDVLGWGAGFGPLTLTGQWWRLVTSMFLHFGVLHLALNMWALLNLGTLAEPLFGSRGFFALYALSGVGGSLASVFVNPLVVSGGASGAIFGVAGGLIVRLALVRADAGQLTAMRGQLPSLLTFLVYNLIYGFGSSGIDNIAHLGGLVTGAAFGLALVVRDPGRYRTALATGAFAILLGFGADAVRRARGPEVMGLLQQQSVAVPPELAAEIERLEHLLPQRPDSVGVYTTLANAYLNAMRPEDAIEVLEQGRARWPDNSQLLAGLGTADLAARRFDAAVAHYGRAAELDPADQGARYNHAYAYFARAMASSVAGAGDRGYADFLHVLRLNADTALWRQATEQLSSLRNR